MRIHLGTRSEVKGCTRHDGSRGGRVQGVSARIEWHWCAPADRPMHSVPLDCLAVESTSALDWNTRPSPTCSTPKNPKEASIQYAHIRELYAFGLVREFGRHATQCELIRWEPSHEVHGAFTTAACACRPGAGRETAWCGSVTHNLGSGRRSLTKQVTLSGEGHGSPVRCWLIKPLEFASTSPETHDKVSNRQLRQLPIICLTFVACMHAASTNQRWSIFGHTCMSHRTCELMSVQSTDTSTASIHRRMQN